MVGYFGGRIFEVSDQKVLSFSDLSRTNAPRVGTHDLINRKPASEFIGSGLETLSFSLFLHVSLGVNVAQEISAWNDMADRGEVALFVLGGKPVGGNKWLITSLSTAYGLVTGKGGLISATIDVSLQEYV